MEEGEEDVPMSDVEAGDEEADFPVYGGEGGEGFYDEDSEMPQDWAYEESIPTTTEPSSTTIESSDSELTKCYIEKKEKEYRWELLTDDEKKHHSKIYIEIIMDIGTQNRILNAVKQRLHRLTESNPCPTACEKREIRGLKVCIERETLRQYCYIKKAQEFLSNAPIGPWDGLPVIISEVDKEFMPTMLGCTITDGICKRTLEKEEEKPSKKGTAP